MGIKGKEVIFAVNLKPLIGQSAVYLLTSNFNTLSNLLSWGCFSSLDEKIEDKGVWSLPTAE